MTFDFSVYLCLLVALQPCLASLEKQRSSSEAQSREKEWDPERAGNLPESFLIPAKSKLNVRIPTGASYCTRRAEPQPGTRFSDFQSGILKKPF